MPTSQYMNNYIHNKNEQRVHMSMVDELIRLWGMDVYYIPRVKEGQEDLIYGEDVLKKFKEAYLLCVYQENNTQYLGDQTVFTQFGLEIRNEINVFMAEIEFDRCVRQNNNQLRPMEGDLIYVPQLNKVGELYEIRFVNDNASFSIWGKQQPHFYKMNLEKFKYSNEKIDTGVGEIDQIQMDYAYSKTLYYSDIMGELSPLDIIYQSDDGTADNMYARGTVSTIDTCCGSFVVFDIAGEFKGDKPAYVFEGSTQFTLHVDKDDHTHAQKRAGNVDNQLINLEQKVSVTTNDNASGLVGTWGD